MTSSQSRSATTSATSTTRAVRAGIESDKQHGAVVPPLHLSSNFAFKSFAEKREYDYTRSGNPTRDAFGDALADQAGTVIRPLTLEIQATYWFGG